MDAQNIPIRGSLLQLQVSDWPASARMGLSGLDLPAPDAGQTAWIEQLIPPGPYTIVTNRLKMNAGKTRAIPVGAFDVFAAAPNIDGETELFVPVAGTNALEAVENAETEASIHRGRDILTLRLLKKEAASRLGFALVDPNADIALDRRNKRRGFLQPFGQAFRSC